MQMNRAQYNPMQILIIDDEAVALKNLRHILNQEDYQITTAGSGPEGLQAMQQSGFDLVITDLKMEQVDGMQILNYSRSHKPDTCVIMITGNATIDSAIEAMRAGAFHYITKPFRLDEVRKVVSDALELRSLRQENSRLKEIISATEGDEQFLTQDTATQRVLDSAKQIASSHANIIISGESGTGKELMARLIHQHSLRREHAFVAVNCGAFSEELLSNELFGHSKGAYTGATESRAGLIESADGGTLFLDEVTEMSPAMQVKLLRVIQEGELRRIGDTKTVHVDVRYLSATNRDLQEAVATGRFRHDLYYRLNVMHLHLSPLRDRKGDVPLLAHYFLKRHGHYIDNIVTDIDPQAMTLLDVYSFPGNVRELSNLIERGIALTSDHIIQPQNLPSELQALQGMALPDNEEQMPSLEQQEIAYIRWV
ncbi:MAG: sigma-54 dependent transcriptional regulator, partial [Gammaproteobacteria bacterium]|nr:sigma-54 dependent transcriptional regulator [Gammaproteobacteria bacterium]